MRRSTIGSAASALGLALAACSSGDGASGGEDDAAQPVALASVPDVESGVSGDNAETADGSAASPAPDAANGVDNSSPVAPALGKDAAPANDLTAYIGKFPFEKVGGVAWNDHPMVVAGVRKTVTDATVRRAMQSSGGPSAPIATYQGKVGAWGCEQHNCGDHQWAVLVNPGSGATDVCYHNAEQTGENSRWFLAGGREESRPGNCSVV